MGFRGMINLDFLLVEALGTWNVQALHVPGMPVVAMGFPDIYGAGEWLWEHVEEFQREDD